MISHSPPIFSHSPPISFLADFINNHQNVNCNDASHYCRPQLITLASKAMVNNAQQRTTSHVFGTANSINNLMISNNSNIPLAQYLNSATSTHEMGRRLERMVTVPVLSVQPKSCLRHKSCLQKISPASIELTDKNTDTNKINEQKRGETMRKQLQRRHTGCWAQQPSWNISSAFVTRPRCKVTFADDEGLSLTQVRVMSEPSNVPPYWSTKFLEQITQGLVTPHPADQWTVDFKQPASDYLAFRQSIESNFVSLENVIVRDEESIVVGTVKVKNTSFEKEVVVRCTWDDWKSQQDIFCTFNKAYGPATCAHVIFDTFSFKITLPPSSKRLEFCICFRAENKEYWDNNKGHNYTITKRSPFYYNAISPYDKNSKHNPSSCQSQKRSALTKALNNNANVTETSQHYVPSPYW